MNPHMRAVLLDTKLPKATLLNMYNPTSMETLLKALREQSKEDDQMKSVGEITSSVAETLLDWESILKERGGFWEGHSGTYPLITSPDSCKGSRHDQPSLMLKKSQRRSMKQE